MHEEEIIKQLRIENEQLKREIELLKEYIKDLEARLAKYENYENAHTPPSLIGKLKLLQTDALIAEQNSVFRSELSLKLSKKYPILNRSLSQNTELRITVVPVVIERSLPTIQIVPLKADSETIPSPRRLC